MTTRSKPNEIIAESQKVFGVLAKATKWTAVLLAVVVSMFFVAIPLVAWIASPSSECVAGHPCTLQQQSDGSTVPVTIPKEQGVCFDPSFWENLSQLGYRTSFNGSSEKLYSCTRDSVLSGKCNERMGDTFRFIPKKGVLLPQYWFSPGGSNC